MEDKDAQLKLHLDNLKKEKAKTEKCKGKIKKLKAS